MEEYSKKKEEYEINYEIPKLHNQKQQNKKNLLMLLPFGPLNVAFPTLLRATSSSCASCLRDLCLEGLITVSESI